MTFCFQARAYRVVKHLLAFVMLCAIFVLVGCSSESTRPRYQVSGTVTYAGEPVPSGLVKFEPDVDKGGVGPGSYAPIKNGTYCTEEGLCAGPVKVRICGMDGVEHEVVKDGETVMEESPLFDEYPTEAEVQQQDTVVDFEIPKA